MYIYLDDRGKRIYMHMHIIGAPIMHSKQLTLISHHLCPYVQRASIVLSEKGEAFDRRYVDLAAKPDWFLRISPLGKVPLLAVPRGGADAILFESTAICEYLEETLAGAPLH